MGESLPLALFGVVKGWQHTEQLGQCPNRRHGLRPRQFVSFSVTAPLGGTGCVTTAQFRNWWYWSISQVNYNS
jgi:hypothetical protein